MPWVSSRRWLTLATLAVVGVLGAWWLADVAPDATVSTPDPDSNEFEATVPASDAERPESQALAQPHVLERPTAAAVIADPQCRMVVGQRTASDTALVYLPLGDGAWFAVVNTFGIVFDATLPFVPERPEVGKRPDGTILVGFGLADKVQVVHDGSVIYEFDEVWSFGIADDGSSFFVVEPLAGNASRLVVRNLELREEHHFDLGTSITPTNHSLDFGLDYSVDLAEVIVRPSRSRGGASRFFPVVGGVPREVVVEPTQGMPTRDLSVFATSELSYHARNVGDKDRNRYSLLWRIVKVEREFGNGGERGREVWTRDLQFLRNLSMQVSLDGAWLVLTDPVAGVEVLHTEDGETVLSYPEGRENRMQWLRFVDTQFGHLAFASRFANPAHRFRARFVGDQLLVTRSEAGKADEGWDVVAYELDPVSKRAYQVRWFKVEPGVDETEQTFAIRTSLDPAAPTACTNHALLDRRLEIRDGRLTYRASTY